MCVNNYYGDNGRGSWVLMKEMSEEDLQDQMDEMEVLQSIYENDIVINKESSLKSFHMNIKVK